MPATFTHAIFAKDVYNCLPKKYSAIIEGNIKQYMMFSQSMDSMMFYNIESIMPGKELRRFQHTFHSTKTNEFFSCLINYIKNEKLYNDKEVMSFLYGFICHYVLDSNVHPFVFYKTGLFDKKDKQSYKYNNLHSFMETYLDNYMIRERLSTNPFKFKIHNYCFYLKPFSKNLNKCINYVFGEVFCINNMDEIYYKSLKQMRSFLEKYRYDKTGIKKKCYKIIDFITPQYIFKFEVLSYNYKPKNTEYFLNKKHDIWFNPCDKKLFSYESFDDLYRKSINEAIDIIKNTNSYFYNSRGSIKEIFRNKSYITGLDCNLELNLKNFYF